MTYRSYNMACMIPDTMYGPYTHMYWTWYHNMSKILVEQFVFHTKKLLWIRPYHISYQDPTRFYSKGLGTR